MPEKINIKELEVMIANIVKEMGINEIFTEEMEKTLQGRIKEKVSSDKPVVMKEEDIEEPQEDVIGPVPVIKTNNTEIPTPTSETPSINSDKSNYTPVLPSFVEKAQPGQIFVFDHNELSFGGENLSNREFRLLSDPDKKRSMHQMWAEDGKIKAEVYIAKFEKLGEIIFDPFNGSSKLEEKRFDPELNNIAQPFNENPNAPGMDSTSAELTLKKNPESSEENTTKTSGPEDAELETKVFDILSRFLKGMTKHTANGPTGLNIDAISAGQVKNPEVAPTDTINAIIGEEPGLPIMEGKNIKMLELVKEGGNFKKIDAPQELIESVQGKSNKAALAFKNDEVQKWIFEGNEYFFPATIISYRKCYTNKNTL